MLKKQTVWLLTMLSLMIVLSVYYIMIDKGDQQAFMDTNESENSLMSGAADGNDEDGGDENNQGMTNENNDGENNENGQGVVENNDGEDNENVQKGTENNEDNDDQVDNSNEDIPDVSDFTNIGKEELFTMNRMEIQNERSKKVGYLEDVVASTNATTEEKNKALDDINRIDATKTKEYILQNTIMTKSDTYQDVLVRSEDEMVYVHVMTEELSKAEAIDIMQLVKDEFGELTVDINYN